MARIKPKVETVNSELTKELVTQCFFFFMFELKKIDAVLNVKQKNCKRHMYKIHTCTHEHASH